MTETRVSYEGGLRCRAEHAESGAIVITDAPRENHGGGEGFSPSDLLAVSLGSCILSMMGVTARAMKRDIAGATATVTKEMGDAPRRFTRIAVAVSVPGTFDARERARLEAAAHACPVHNVLDLPVPIAITWAG